VRNQKPRIQETADDVFRGAPVKNFPDLLHSSIDAMFAIDGNQRVMFWNHASEELTGIPAAKAIGKPCHEVLHGREPSGGLFCKANCELGQLARGGPPPAVFSMRISSKERGNIQLNVGTMLVPSPDDREWMVVHVMRRGHCKSSAGAGMAARKQRSHATADQASHGLCLLTEREREILCMLTNGMTTAAISKNLNISMATVRNHIQRLMAKLNVHTRIEAVSCAHQHLAM
jgi:DNA-binding CsgD family transcriptional regulator